MDSAHREYKKVLLAFVGVIFLLTISLNISGCSGVWTDNTAGSRKYYTGYDSLTMKFLDDAPPTQFFYDSSVNAVSATAGSNEIPISIEIKNTGASYAFGTLYIHGYDPHIMEIAGGIRPSGSILGRPVAVANQQGYFSFSVGGQYSNVYLGIPGNTVGTSGASWTKVDPTTGRTYNYGFDAFVNGQRQFSGFSFTYDSRGYGGALATNVLQMFGQYGNFNTFIAMRGDTPDNPGGDMDVFDFPTVIYYLPPSLDQFTQPIMATACFSYATHASLVVCVDPKPGSNTKKVCRPQTVSGGSGQGAPVAVTSIEQHASSTKTVFTIHVKHNGGSLADVYDLNSLWKCDPDSGAIIKSTDKNVVYINYIAISGANITDNCVPSSGILRLDSSGNGEIACTFYYPANGPGSAYQAPLEVELGYGYSKNIYRDILIKRI